MFGLMLINMKFSTLFRIEYRLHFVNKYAATPTPPPPHPAPSGFLWGGVVVFFVSF